MAMPFVLSNIMNRLMAKKTQPKIVRPAEFKKVKPKKIVSLANHWADFFIKSNKVELDRNLNSPLDLCAEIALCKWQSAGVLQVRRMLFDQGDALNRTCHNKKYDVVQMLQKERPITDGFSPSSSVLLIPEIPATMTWGNFIEAPKKYIPFLIGVQHSFDKVIFYYDKQSNTYYEELENTLYLNWYHDDDDPIYVIYEVMAKRVLPLVSGKLWELQSFQNMGISSIDKTSYSLEERFIHDYISYKAGQNTDVFVNSFFSGLGI
jgi:hypothetical protein